MDINDARDILQEHSVRPPAPGEVWKFDALEAHAFYSIFIALSCTESVPKENPTLRSYLRAFKVVEDAYKLAESDLNLPAGITTTPTEQDRGFFISLVPFFELFLESEYAKTEKIKELQAELGTEHACPCGGGDCAREDELPCGHNAKEHLTLLKGWYQREILETEKFAATRRAIEAMPYEESIIGKPIIARSDLERVVEEAVEKEIGQEGAWGQAHKDLVEGFLKAFPEMNRDEAKAAAKKHRESTLIKESEKEYRVIDI